MDIVVADGKHYFNALIHGREDELTPAIQGLLGLPMLPNCYTPRQF